MGAEARGGGVVARTLGLASTDPAGDARVALRGGAHVITGCPETLVLRYGDAITWLDCRLRAAGRPGVVLVADELWALRSWQTFRHALVALWTSPLLCAPGRPPLLGLSGTFDTDQVAGT